jgi:hypothetical protein
VKEIEQFTVKIDPEGKILLPKQVQNALGNTLTLKKTAKGYILTSKQYIANEKLKKIITGTHRRTGKPHNATPKEIKSIWDPTKRDPNLKPYKEPKNLV